MDGFQFLRHLQEHMDILFQIIISEFSRKAPKEPKIPSGFSYLTSYDSPKRSIGKSERGLKAPQLGRYESGDLKGPPALRRSQKKGGRRPPKPSR